MSKSYRPHGSGSIRNRGTDRAPKWFAYHFVRMDGKRRQVSQGPFQRKADAEAWLRTELQRVREGRPTLPRRMTTAELLEEWLTVVGHRLAPSTEAEYRRIVRNRLVPHLGSIRLGDLRPGHIASMFDELRKPGASQRGRASGGLSETTLLHTHGVLRTALAWAVRQRLIPSNPAEDVDRPRRDQAEMSIWTPDELARFLAHVANDRLYPLLRLAAYTGMRRSELLGLKWPDVDLRAGTVAIRRTRTKVGYEMVERADTKSRSSTRVVDIDDETVDVMAKWSARQGSEREQWGQAWIDTGHVFTSEDGEPVHADHVAQRFERLMRDAPEVPAIRFHDLRHTHASLLLAAGIPVLDVARRIGHASAAVTLNVYAHVIPGQGRKAANAFASLLDDQADEE